MWCVSLKNVVCWIMLNGGGEQEKQTTLSKLDKNLGKIINKFDNKLLNSSMNQSFIYSYHNTFFLIVQCKCLWDKCLKTRICGEHSSISWLEKAGIRAAQMGHVATKGIGT